MIEFLSEHEWRGMTVRMVEMPRCENPECVCNARELVYLIALSGGYDRWLWFGQSAVAEWDPAMIETSITGVRESVDESAELYRRLAVVGGVEWPEDRRTLTSAVAANFYLIQNLTLEGADRLLAESEERLARAHDVAFRAVRLLADQAQSQVAVGGSIFSLN